MEWVLALLGTVSAGLGYAQKQQEQINQQISLQLLQAQKELEREKAELAKERIKTYIVVGIIFVMLITAIIIILK
jgi:hypothetical protein